MNTTKKLFAVINHRDTEVYRTNYLLRVINSVFLRASVVTLALGFVSKMCPVILAAEAKPNIIWIVSDDCGYNEFSFNGSKTPTPRIDSIATGGVTMTNGYVTAPVCSPTRAGLLTGRYQQRFGYYANPPLKNVAIEGVPLDETMLSAALKPAGYRTIAVGKWHLGWDPKFHPCEYGFDDFYGFVGGARNYFPMTDPKFHNALMLDRQIVPGAEDFKYTTELFGDRAVDYIDRYKDQPFFLYLAFNATHGPRAALPDDIAKVGGGKKLSDTIAAMTIALDRNVGKVLDAIDRNQLAENTLVVLINDNGGEEKHDNTPLRGFKQEVYEGGIRVPFVMRWPNVLPAGVKYEKPVISLDLFATSLVIAGLTMPTEKPLDGVNLIPFLTCKDTARPHQTLFWLYGSGWAVRDGDMKLVLNRDRKGLPELFDLANDLSEKADLAVSQPDTVVRLESLFDNWNSHNKPALWGSTKARTKDE